MMPGGRCGTTWKCGYAVGAVYSMWGQIRRVESVRPAAQLSSGHYISPPASMVAREHKQAQQESLASEHLYTQIRFDR